MPFKKELEMCDCLKQVNKDLAAYNGKVATSVFVTEDIGLKIRVLIATEKVDKKKRKPAPRLPAAFCPFCGEKAE